MTWASRIATDEPARLRAFWTALVAVLAGVGVTVSSDLSGWVEGGIIAAGVLLPVIQGETTRAKVTPVAKLSQYDDDGDGEDDVDDDELGPPSEAPPEWLAKAGAAPGDAIPEAVDNRFGES